MDFLKAVNIIGRDLEEAMAMLEQLTGLPGPEKAEIELARSRVRSASDLLRLLPEMVLAEKPAAVADNAEPAPVQVQKHAPVKHQIREQDAAPVMAQREAPEPAKTTADAPEPAKATAAAPEPAKATAAAPEPEPASRKEQPSMPETAPVAEPAKHSSPSRTGQEPAKPILADRFSQSGTLGDKISPARQDDAISSAIHSKPIADIGAAIGINDRFRYIRELFSGDTLAYNDTIRRLNSSASLGEAMKILDESTVMGSDPATQSSFVDVVRRKFSLNV